MSALSPAEMPGIELARELELAEASGCREFALAASRIYPDGGIKVVNGAGGVGVFYGPSDPLNAVKGAGLSGPVDPREWDAIEAPFVETGSPVVVDLCPLAEDAFITMLGERGYRIGSFETVMFRVLDGSINTPATTPGLTIGPAESAEEFTHVIGVGFADGGEPIKFAVDFGRVRAELPNSVALLARIDGVPAGGANMTLNGRVAHMNGAAVLPQFRGRGIQSALTAARLVLAHERGCTLTKLDVRAGTASHRNAHRAGFRVAYTRPQMVRPAG